MFLHVGDKARVISKNYTDYLAIGTVVETYSYACMVLFSNGHQRGFKYDELEKVEGIIYTLKLSDEERSDIVCALSEYLQFLTGREDSDGATDEERQRISKLITRFDKYGF